MEAMYPGDADATTGSFVVLNPEGVDAVRALVDAWEASGKEPASEALEALAPLRASLTLAVPDGETRGTVTLRVSLPREYPGSPPALEVSASHLPRGAATEMADTLVRFAATLTSDLGEDGGECLMELAVEAQNEASSCAEREARRRAELGAATRGSDDEPDACHAVVRVDHMNDSKGYVRTLQRWCANLGLDARVFWSEPSGVPTAASDATSRPQKSWTSEDVDGEPETTARGVVGPPTGGRVENVFVVVGGDGDDVQKFLARLRTEFIDVDSKGKKCRARCCAAASRARRSRQNRPCLTSRGSSARRWKAETERWRASSSGSTCCTSGRARIGSKRRGDETTESSRDARPIPTRPVIILNTCQATRTMETSHDARPESAGADDTPTRLFSGE